MKHGRNAAVLLLVMQLNGCGSGAADVLDAVGLLPDPEIDYQQYQLGREPVDPVPTQLRYSGLRTDARLGEDNFSAFLPAFIKRPQLSTDTFESLKAMNCISGSGYATNDLGIGAIATLFGPVLTFGTYKTVAEQCQITRFNADGERLASVTFDGQYSIEIEAYDPETDAYQEFRYHFDRWRISYADGSFIQYDGVVQVQPESEYSCDQTQVFNISITTDLEQEGALLENLLVDTDCAPEGDYGILNYQPTKVDGAIYLQHHGKVTISSDDVAFKTANGRFHNGPGGYDSVTDDVSVAFEVFFPDETGAIDYQAAGSISLTSPTAEVSLTSLAGPEEEIEQRSSNTPIGITLSDAPGESQSIETVPSWFVYFAVPMDFGDADSDGMWNSWESIYGFDPQTNDAAADMDGDGLTNGEEFVNSSNPLNPDTPTARLALYAVPSTYLEPPATPPEFFAGQHRYFLAFEQTHDFDVFFEGYFTDYYSQLVPYVDLTIRLPDAADNYQLDTQHDCSLISDQVGNRIACPNFPTQFFTEPGKKLGTLTITAGETAHNTCVALEVDAERPIKPPSDSEGFCLVALGKPLPPNVASSSQAFILENLWVENLSYPIQIEAVNYAITDDYTLTIEMQEKDVSIAPIRFQTAGSGASCRSAGVQRFTCQGSLKQINDVVIKYKAPDTQGSVKMLWEITSEFADGTTVQGKTERTLAFGQGSDALQSLIDDAISARETDIELPEGIYIGDLYIPEALNLKGNNTAIWLTQSTYQGDHSSYALEANQSLGLTDLDLYIREIPLRLNTGVIESSNISVLGKASKEAFLSDGLCHGSLVISANRISIEQHHLLTDQNTSATALVRVAESAWGSECSREIKNNLVTGKGMGHTLLLDRSAHDPGAGDDVYTNVIANNTLVDVPGVIQLVQPDNTFSLVANNLHLVNGLQDTVEAIRLGDDSLTIETPVAFVDLRGNMLMFPATFQTDANFVVPPEHPFAELITPSLESPTVDRGVDVTEWLNTDLEGNPRPSGAFFDIGAYEYQQ